MQQYPPYTEDTKIRMIHKGRAFPSSKNLEYVHTCQPPPSDDLSRCGCRNGVLYRKLYCVTTIVAYHANMRRKWCEYGLVQLRAAPAEDNLAQ
ncbi:hypothetical protein CDAR_258401 [Caerostris darwini]|uniref:Uncharacterized protein n=1 Tax=Caerostris darwini TaxID=1538125 RepID=A0AAV4VB03_9ARAC|nr:hypothetical protein CDAR_258401 [Caerostris darwini]